MRRIEATLLVAGLLLLSWVGGVVVTSKWDQARQNRELDALRAAHEMSRRKPAADITLPAPPPPAPVLPRGVLGRVEIPRLKMSAIVRSGVDARTLRRAVGHVPETALPGATGNSALAAHRDTFFRPLRHIRTGDRIQVTTAEGVHEYRVSKTHVVNPDDVSVLEPTRRRTLTLITCFPFNYIGSAPQRFIVTATADEPRTEPAAAPAAGPMAGRHSSAAAVPASVSLVQAVAAQDSSMSSRRPVKKVKASKKPPQKSRAQRTVVKRAPQKKPGIWGKVWRAVRGPVRRFDR